VPQAARLFAHVQRRMVCLFANFWLSSLSAPLTSYLYPETGSHRSQDLKTLPTDCPGIEDDLTRRSTYDNTYVHLYTAYTRLTMLCQQEVKSGDG
jgi:hypothetical protein